MFLNSIPQLSSLILFMAVIQSCFSTAAAGRICKYEVLFTWHKGMPKRIQFSTYIESFIQKGYNESLCGNEKRGIR